MEESDEQSKPRKKSHKGRRIDDGSYQTVQIRVSRDLHLWYRTVSVMLGIPMQTMMEQALQDYRKKQ